MFKNSRRYVIELDGITYGFSKNRLEQIVELKDLEGDKWLVTDMHEAISRTMTVDAEYKYVEIMVRRKLQESGEFDEPVSIITHWKKKKGKNTTDIFFTALPTQIYYSYLDRIKEDENNIILFPLYSVLFGILKRIRSKKPVAVVFLHNRFADLIIGTKNRIYYANRCVAFDTSNEQLAALWDTIRTDIKGAKADHGIEVSKVFWHNWTDSAPEPDWSDEPEIKISCFDREDVSFEKEKQAISFLKAVRAQPCSASSSPSLAKVFYYAGKSIIYLNMIFSFSIASRPFEGAR